MFLYCSNKRASRVNTLTVSCCEKDDFTLCNRWNVNMAILLLISRRKKREWTVVHSNWAAHLHSPLCQSSFQLHTYSLLDIDRTNSPFLPLTTVWAVSSLFIDPLLSGSGKHGWRALCSFGCCGLLTMWAAKMRHYLFPSTKFLSLLLRLHRKHFRQCQNDSEQRVRRNTPTIGQSSFSEIREDGLVFVDKSLLSLNLHETQLKLLW